jgi:hypothetical protein
MGVWAQAHTPMSSCLASCGAFFSSLPTHALRTGLEALTFVFSTPWSLSLTPQHKYSREGSRSRSAWGIVESRAPSDAVTPREGQAAAPWPQVRLREGRILHRASVGKRGIGRGDRRRGAERPQDVRDEEVAAARCSGETQSEGGRLSPEGSRSPQIRAGYPQEERARGPFCERKGESRSLRLQ